MALRLVEHLYDRTAAEAAQLMIEYDPQPHVSCGARPEANDDVLERVAGYASLRR